MVNKTLQYNQYSQKYNYLKKKVNVKYLHWSDSFTAHHSQLGVSTTIAKLENQNQTYN